MSSSKRSKRVLIVSSEDIEEVYGDRLMVRRTRTGVDAEVSPPQTDPGGAQARGRGRDQ
ncbi:MAG TPA: hypothetical protein VER33_27385 [Polyangiaceae bacterium]|nr:hypothetical protein [Polyangiaceae bacterium]